MVHFQGTELSIIKLFPIYSYLNLFNLGGSFWGLIFISYNFQVFASVMKDIKEGDKNSSPALKS